MIWPYYIGDDKIISVIPDNKGHVHSLVFYDLNCHETRRIDISRYIIDDMCDIEFDDILYLIDNDTILVIDNQNITMVKNTYHVQVYSYYLKCLAEPSVDFCCCV